MIPQKVIKKHASRKNIGILKSQVRSYNLIFVGSLNNCKVYIFTKLNVGIVCCCSVTKSSPTFLWPHEVQHTRLPWASLSLGICSNSYPLSWWRYTTISSFASPSSFCHQSFSAAGSFPMSQFFASGGQNIGASTSASVLPKNIQDWFPLGLTGLISLKSKGLSRVSSNTIQKHQFFYIQLSLWSNSHIQTWLLKNHSLD